MTFVDQPSHHVYYVRVFCQSAKSSRLLRPCLLSISQVLTYVTSVSFVNQPSHHVYYVRVFCQSAKSSRLLRPCLLSISQVITSITSVSFVNQPSHHILSITFYQSGPPSTRASWDYILLLKVGSTSRLSDLMGSAGNSCLPVRPIIDVWVLIGHQEYATTGKLNKADSGIDGQVIYYGFTHC